MDDAARTEFLPEPGLLWVIRIFRFLFRIQMVEIAEELVEAMGRGQELVLVTPVA